MIFLVSSLACGLVDDLTALIALRSTQGLGAALLLAASLPVMALLTGVRRGRAPVVGPRRDARRGARPGRRRRPHRAVRLARHLHRPGPGGRRRARGGRDAARCGGSRPRGAARTACPFWANLGLLFAFGALVGALFLAVLMIVTVWGFGPLYGALIVSVLPLAALLVSPLSQRVGPGWSAIAGSPLLAAGPGRPRAAAVRRRLVGRGRARGVRRRLRPAGAAAHGRLGRGRPGPGRLRARRRWAPATWGSSWCCSSWRRCSPPTSTPAAIARRPTPPR